MINHCSSSQKWVITPQFFLSHGRRIIGSMAVQCVSGGVAKPYLYVTFINIAYAHYYFVFATSLT